MPVVDPPAGLEPPPIAKSWSCRFCAAICAMLCPPADAGLAEDAAGLEPNASKRSEKSLAGFFAALEDAVVEALAVARGEAAKEDLG